MPETANECVVQVLGHADPVPLGTVVTLPEDTEDIRRTEYTVVGQVQDPQYFSATQETSTVGDGILDALVFVQDGELTADYYTVCYLKVADAAQYDNYSDEYQTAVDTVADRLDAISKEHCVARGPSLSRMPLPSWTMPNRPTASRRPKPSASLHKPSRS